jgi:transposase-like protein
MQQLHSAPVWPVFKQKLKEHYQHLTDDDLAMVESDWDAWLEKLQRVVGRSPLEIVRLAEEVIEERYTEPNPLWLAFARNEEWHSRHWPSGVNRD